MAKVMVGKASELGEGKMTGVTAGGKEILVANVGGTYYAMNNICTHAGAQLNEGRLESKQVICPWHGAKWDVTTGNLEWFPQKLKPLGSYRVTVEDGTVYVEV